MGSYKSVVVSAGRGGWGGPLTITPTDAKPYIYSVTGGGIHPVAARIAELTGGTPFDGFKSSVPFDQIAVAVIDCGKELSEIVYSTTVTAVGELVPDFADQGVLVFFGQDAPIELHEFSIIHTPDVVTRAPQVGDTITLQDTVYNVLAVGSVASDNLLNLGHLDLKANGLTEPEMPGDVNVEAVSLPKVNVGDRLIVTSQTK